VTEGPFGSGLSWRGVLRHAAVNRFIDAAAKKLTKNVRGRGGIEKEKKRGRERERIKSEYDINQG